MLHWYPYRQGHLLATPKFIVKIEAKILLNPLDSN